MRKLLESFLDSGIDNLRTMGSICPVAFIITDTGTNICMLDFSNTKYAVETLRTLCRQLNANKGIIMAEAYTSRDFSGIRPSKASDREESIVIQGEDVNGNSCAIIQPFHRTKNGKIQLKKKITQLSVSSSNRWSGIIKQ